MKCLAVALLPQYNTSIVCLRQHTRFMLHCVLNTDRMQACKLGTTFRTKSEVRGQKKSRHLNTRYKTENLNKLTSMEQVNKIEQQTSDRTG